MASTVEMNAGRPVRAAMASIFCGVSRAPVADMKTPRPLAAIASSNTSSSWSVAIVEGIGRPP